MSLRESRHFDYQKIDPMAYKMRVLIALYYNGAALYKSNIFYYMRSRYCVVGWQPGPHHSGPHSPQVQVLTLQVWGTMKLPSPQLDTQKRKKRKKYYFIHNILYSISQIRLVDQIIRGPNFIWHTSDYISSHLSSFAVGKSVGGLAITNEAYPK